jgi:hypothetical protein
VGYVTLDDRPSLGRDLPQDYYPELMAVASSLADTVKWATLILNEEEKVNQSLKWDGIDAWTGQELYVANEILTPNAKDAIIKVAAGMSNLDDALKIFTAKATKENGIPPTDKGTTEKSQSAYWDRDAAIYARGNAFKLLEKWKWFDLLGSTPTNWWDETAETYRNAAKDFGFPDFEGVITTLKWGIGILIAVSIMGSSKK